MKKKISNRELDFMIAESIWHAQLDALGCPAGNFIGKRLSDWCKLKGVDPFNKVIEKCKCVPPNFCNKCV